MPSESSLAPAVPPGNVRPAKDNAAAANRAALVRRGLRLSYATLGYNLLEAAAALAAGAATGSVSLLGFGMDSAVEVTASLAVQWRLRADADAARRARAERHSHRVVGGCFLVLAAWVAAEAAKALWTREGPVRSVPGVVVLTLSVVVMPVLARAKRRVAAALDSGALAAEATQTALCAYLSAIALVGVALNAICGWWWTDPLAALVMTPIIAKEGWEGVRGQPACADCHG